MKTIAKLMILSALVFSSCSEALIEDYIEGSWEMKTYLRNDVDETAEIKISNYVETYQTDGVFARTYLDGKNALVEESGTFSINEDNKTIHLSDISSIADFSEAHSTLSTSTVNVLVFDDEEYAYSFENGGDTHEFRFIKK